MSSCIFTNDNNVEILLPVHIFSDIIATRDNHEVYFRRIHTYMINNNIIDTTKNIIDLGAWIGDNTLPWAKNIEGIVFAIDPSSVNCGFIDEMKCLNSLTNIQIIQKAISDKNEILTTNENLQHCSFVYNNSENNGTNKVESYSLDGLYSSNEINNIGYIHLDVEGMEYRVIKGATNLIEHFRPIITFEQHFEIDDVTIIVNYLKERNYNVFLINEILLGCRPDCRNFLAIPEEKLPANFVKNVGIYTNAPQILVEI
jgi:FkbM family methyltransferase